MLFPGLASAAYREIVLNATANMGVKDSVFCRRLYEAITLILDSVTGVNSKVAPLNEIETECLATNLACLNQFFTEARGQLIRLEAHVAHLFPEQAEDVREIYDRLGEP